MEEILASIRRIIEDSDTVQQPGAEDLAKLDAEPAAVGVDDMPPESEIEAFRAELDDVEINPEPARPSMSMADIQASVAVVPPVTPEPKAAEIHAFNTASKPDFGSYQSTLENERDAPESLPEDAPFDARVEPVFVAEKPAPAPSAGDARSAIISDQTGRQVAAAFGELSEAFAASRRRSFDEMAEEMLRPMLQDWLDNNLPTLVEKLVREEIERVARGGQG
ncbi:PopZ family protein [Mesorhizobium sp. CAU 1732]|uniref:PopZ family protein n=1 Tax=Mesorhizobium sp. CAU 1732 TaxID=3140358 RepID=UPI0032613E36